MRFGRKSVLKTQVFYVRFVKGCLAQNSNIYSEMKMKLLDKTDGNEYIIEYSQSVWMGVPGGSLHEKGENKC